MQRNQLLAERYRLGERLGRGGMSVVWRAHDEVLERDVAVKVLVTTDPGARWRIRAEAKAAARLSHPNVTNVYDYGESPLAGVRVPFVVMELLTGTTLAQRLTEGPLPPRDALRVCAEVAAGLAAAHAEGLVHRDVKPENVMLTPTGAKVVDFGIAASAGTPEIDAEGRLLGTPAYFAPERLDAGEVLAASDVYALGLLLHRLLTGRLPWRRGTRTGLLHAHLHELPAPLPDLRGVPPEVTHLHQWCLAKDPADRPTAAEAARILAVASVRTPAPGLGWPPPAHPPLRSPALRTPTRSAGRPRPGPRSLVAAGVAVLGLVALVGILGESLSRRPDEPRIDNGDTARVAMPATGGTLRPPGPPGPPGADVPRGSRPAASRTPSSGVDPTGRSADSAGPTPSTGARTPTEVESRGGTVAVRCGRNSAEIVAVAPAAGYLLGTYDPGPSREVRVELVSATNRSVVTVRCANERPIPRVKEHD